jgi:signal peptidase I
MILKIIKYLGISLILPFILISDAASLPAKPIKKILSILFILIVFGGIWFSGYGQTIMRFYYNLYDFGIINSIKDIHVIGESMMPTIKNGSYVELASAKNNTIEYGDIISFSNLETGKASYIKRVIGLPGDELIIKNGLVNLNNQFLDEPYIFNGLPTYSNTFLHECVSYTVPDNTYLVFGDNRTVSQDSRVLGYIKKIDINGIIKTHLKPKYLLNPPQTDLSRSIVDPVLLFAKINTFRIKNSVNSLMSDPTLSNLALHRATEIENIIENNQVFTDISESARTAGYANLLIHEYIVYGKLTEEEIINQINEIGPEKDVFLSSNYYNMAISEPQKTENACAIQITVILISWPKIPTYDQSIIDKWKSEEVSSTNLIKAVQSLTGNTGVDQVLLNKLITSLAKQTEISSRIYRKMSAREPLNDVDNHDINNYPNIVKQTNQTIEAVMTKPNSATANKPSNVSNILTNNFKSYGVMQLEPGILADLTKLSINNNTIEATINLTNNTQKNTIFSPLRFQILTNSHSGSITSSLSEVKLSPLTSQIYTFNFELLPDPPSRFVYISSNGDTIDLAILYKK